MANKKETAAEKKEAAPKKTYEKNDNVMFVSVSEKQIVSTFKSKDKKDKNGNPFVLNRIILPNSYSEEPFPAGSTIVVPSFLISTDKFREGHKVVKLEKDREYQIDLKGNDFLKVDGQRLKNAFNLKSKENEKTHDEKNKER